MSTNFDKKYYIGKSSDGKWASVYAYKPKNQSILLEKGEVFAVISLSGPKGFSAHTAGNIILDFLHESYFESDDRSPLHSLEHSVLKTANKLGQIVDNDQNIGEDGIDLNISAMCVVDKIVYFVNLGQGTIFMQRDDRIVDVNAALKDPSGEGMIKSASTVYDPNDKYLILTSQAREAYTKEELADALENFDIKHMESKPLETESLLAFITIANEESLAHGPHIHDEELVEENIGAEVEPEAPMIKRMMETKPEVEAEDEDMEEEVEEVKDHDEHDEDFDEEMSVPYKPEDLHKPKQKVEIVEKVKEMFSGVRTKFTAMEIDKKVKERWNNLKPEGTDQTTFEYIVSQVKLKAGKIYRTLYKSVWLDFLQMDQGIYLRNARRGTNWRLIGVLSVFGVVFLYLFISITSTNQQRARELEEARKTLASVESTVEDLDPKINSILGVFETYNRERSTYQSALDGAKEGLTKLEILTEEKDKINSLNARIDEMKNKLDRKIVVDSPDVIYDFATKVAEDVDLTDMEIGDNIIYISDAAKGKVYSLDFYGNSFRDLATGLQSPQSIVSNDDGELLGSDKSSTEPFFAINKNSGAVNRFTGIVSQGLGSVKQIADFKFNDANRIYFIKSEGTPIQYIGEVGAGYAGAFDRFADGSFSTVRDIEVVDGKVYLLKPGEGASRYFGDQQEQFTLYGLTTSELQNVLNSTTFDVSGNYVIYGNSLGRSIVFTTKSSGDDFTQSNFVAQIMIKNNDFNYLSDIREIKIDYTSGNIFVLDGTRLLRFNYREVEKLAY